MITQIAAHIDLFPTLLELCGVPQPATKPLDGRSLVPLLDGRTDDWPDRILFCQHRGPEGPGGKTGALRTQRYRLVNEGRGWELFDMVADPDETKDISAAEPDRKRELVAAYDRWWAEVLPGARLPVPPVPVGYDEENPVSLPAPQSHFDGGLTFSGRAPNNSWLTHWTSLGATATWNIDAVRGGNYEISLMSLCPEADAGSRVQVSLGHGGAPVETTIKATPIHQIPSPDREPRAGETYEMEWFTQPAGTVYLERGTNTLTVRALTKPGKQVMDLKAVLLRRLP
jgi:arylsulfatase A